MPEREFSTGLSWLKIRYDNITKRLVITIKGVSSNAGINYDYRNFTEGQRGSRSDIEFRREQFVFNMQQTLRTLGTAQARLNYIKTRCTPLRVGGTGYDAVLTLYGRDIRSCTFRVHRSVQQRPRFLHSGDYNENESTIESSMAWHTRGP